MSANPGWVETLPQPAPVPAAHGRRRPPGRHGHDSLEELIHIVGGRAGPVSLQWVHPVATSWSVAGGSASVVADTISSGNSLPPYVLRNTVSGMGKRMIQGREISDEQVQAWADEAESGYDVDELQRRWGRPPRAGKASRVVPTRFSDEELSELMARAEREGLDRSTAIRTAVREWVRA